MFYGSPSTRSTIPSNPPIEITIVTICPKLQSSSAGWTLLCLTMSSRVTIPYMNTRTRTIRIALYINFPSSLFLGKWLSLSPPSSEPLGEGTHGLPKRQIKSERVCIPSQASISRRSHGTVARTSMKRIKYFTLSLQLRNSVLTRERPKVGVVAQTYRSHDWVRVKMLHIIQK